MSSGAAALAARELTERQGPDATASRPTPALRQPSAVPPYLTPSWFHARDYHNTSRLVRQTSRKPRKDCESATTPPSPFGGKTTRTQCRARRRTRSQGFAAMGSGGICCLGGSDEVSRRWVVWRCSGRSASTLGNLPPPGNHRTAEGRPVFALRPYRTGRSGGRGQQFGFSQYDPLHEEGRGETWCRGSC